MEVHNIFHDVRVLPSGQTKNIYHVFVRTQQIDQQNKINILYAHALLRIINKSNSFIHECLEMKKNSSNIKRIVGSNHSMSKEGSVAFICKVLDSVNNSGMHVSRLMFKSSINN